MTGRTQRPNTKRALAQAANRARILKTAKALFASNGFWGTNIRLIAEQARLSTGAVFSNFEDKEALFVAVLEEDRQELLTDLDRCTFDETAESNLCSMFSIIYVHYHERLPLLRAKLAMEFDYRPKLRAFFGREEAELTIRIHASMRSDIASGSLVQSDYLEGVIGAVHQSNLRNLLQGESVVELCDRKLRWQVDTLLHPWRSEAKHGRGLRSVG